MGIHCIGIIRRHMVYNTCGELNHLHGQLQLPQFLRFRTEANLLEAIRSEILELGGLTIDPRLLRGRFYNFEERYPYELPGKFELETATWTCLDNVLFVLVHVSHCKRLSAGYEPLLDLDSARVAVFESMMESGVVTEYFRALQNTIMAGSDNNDCQPQRDTDENHATCCSWFTSMLTSLRGIPHKLGYHKRYSVYPGDNEVWGTGNDGESNQASIEYEPLECWCDLCMHQDEEETYAFSSELRNHIVRHPWFMKEQPGVSAGSQSLSFPNVKSCLPLLPDTIRPILQSILMWASVEEARSSCMVSYRKIVEQFAASPASLPLLLVWTSLKNGHRKSVPTDYLFTTELKLDTSGGILFSDDQIKIEAVEVLTDRFQTRSKAYATYKERERPLRMRLEVLSRMCRAMYPQCKVEARGRILQQSPDVWNLDKLDFVAAEGTQDWERLYEFEDERVRIETCLQYLVQ